jgi:hypothetical protein
MTMYPRCLRYASLPILAALTLGLIAGTAQSQSRRNRSTSARVIRGKPTEPPRMKIRVEEGFVSGEIRYTPLQEVLEEIAAWSGVVFEVPAEENAPVTIAFYSTPLEKAILRLVGERNSLVYCDTDPEGKSRISLVRVFGTRGQEKQPSLRYIGSGEQTKTLEDVIDTPEQALRILGESDRLQARERAVAVLADAPVEIALPALTMALDDPAPEVIVAAIEGLSGLGTEEALTSVLRALKNEHPGVRQSAVMAVSLLGSAKNVRDIKPLERDRDASVSAAAEMAVRKLSTQRP